ncbi:MAG: orotate phosphoribosyltransferase [Coriobacteriales bacterium]|nr:orotate phosphoribosyltransferase [Coriobacteriales bacterium]MBQ6586463.1 orotate phosphoribosyltransferase [Coriobacteriales bacterium]
MSELMTHEQILAALEEVQAVRKGHFVLTSGRHSDTYIQCARILEYPRLTRELARVAVSKLPADANINLVVSPAVGGILYGFAVADVLDVNFIFAERESGTMVFRRSFQIPQGARVLVCEDVVTTGGSVKEVCNLIEQAGGIVVAVSSLIDRGGERKFSHPFYPLVELPTASWAAEDCHLCEAGIPTYSPGSRRLNEAR